MNKMKLLLENWREYMKENQEYQIYCDISLPFVATSVTGDFVMCNAISEIIQFNSA